jgi:hypothetical protein
VGFSPLSASETGLAKYVIECAPADASGNHKHKCKNCHLKFKCWPACALVQLRKTGAGVKDWSYNFSLAEKAELQQLANGQSAMAEQKQLKRRRGEEVDLTTDKVGGVHAHFESDPPTSKSICKALEHAASLHAIVFYNF